MIPAPVRNAAPSEERTEPSAALSPGGSSARELSAGETLAFEFTPGARRVLQLSIDKGDLCVAVTLYEPGGRRLLEQLSLSYEPLELSVTAESAGAYRLEIRSLEKGGPGRRFELKVQEAREATARDAQAVAARAAFAEASRQRAEWAESSLRGAVEKYAEAARWWRSAGDAPSAAGALTEAAEVRFILGEYRQALGLYRQVVADSRRTADRQREAEALCHAGRLLSYLGDNEQALQYLKRELDHYSREGVAQTPRLEHAHAEALSHVGEIYYSKGDLLKASEQLARALGIFTEVGDRGGEARARLFGGYVSAAIGGREKAIAQFSRALELYRATGDRAGEALSLTALGVSHSLKRQEEQALRLHREAMSIFRVIGDRQSEAIALNGVGQAYQNLHEEDLALENYREALRLFQANGSLDFAATTVYQIAATYGSKKEHEQALAYLARCVELSRAARKRRIEAYALNEAAAIYAAQGSARQTLNQYRRILRLHAEVGDQRGQAITLNSMGDFYLSRAEPHNALAAYRRALPFSQRANETGVEVSTLYNIARAARAVGDIEGALDSVGQSVDLVESLRANVGSPDLRTSYFAGVHEHYELYVELLMEMERRRPGQGFAAAALKASESARARSLLELLAGAGTDIRQGADPSLLERERELRLLLGAQAAYHMELASGGRSTEETAEAKRELDQLKAEYQEVRSRLRSGNPRHVALTQAVPLRPEEMQAELRGGDTLLLQYALGAERSYVWAVTRDSVSGHALPARATLETLAREVYTLLTARQTVGPKPDEAYLSRVEEADRLFHEKALLLSETLLGPVADRLGEERLLIVAEGVLQYIPFDALPDPRAPLAPATGDGGHPAEPPLLVSRHEIVSLPSISTLAAIRRERPGADAADTLVAVLADPVFSPDDARVAGGDDDLRAQAAPPEGETAELTQRAITDFNVLTGASGLARLTHTSDEADAIQAAVPRGAAAVAKGFEASRETATGPRVGHARIVHFATHGFINSERPELSGIVLTMRNKDGGREDGFLSLQDIHNLNLSADLVVLSACETGLGKDVKGEGLIGLTRGFMYAGSKSVVASLWKVDDRATAELMGHFYRKMLREGLPPAAALRSAKQSVRSKKRWRAPYFWAGFVLQGEYEGVIEAGRASRPAASGLVLVPTLILCALGALLVILIARRRPSRLR